jgi:hypothetical protein
LSCFVKHRSRSECGLEGDCCVGSASIFSSCCCIVVGAAAGQVLCAVVLAELAGTSTTLLHVEFQIVLQCCWLALVMLVGEGLAPVCDDVPQRRLPLTECA